MSLKILRRPLPSTRRVCALRLTRSRFALVVASRAANVVASFDAFSSPRLRQPDDKSVSSLSPPLHHHNSPATAYCRNSALLFLRPHLTATSDSTVTYIACFPPAVTTSFSTFPQRYNLRPARPRLRAHSFFLFKLSALLANLHPHLSVLRSTVKIICNGPRETRSEPALLRHARQ